MSQPIAEYEAKQEEKKKERDENEKKRETRDFINEQQFRVVKAERDDLVVDG